MTVALPPGQKPFVWPCYEIERYNELQDLKVSPLLISEFKIAR